MKTQESLKAICWDLDETLGTFRRVAYEMEGTQAPNWERPISLRYGIKELLHDFSEEAGYVHFVTTSGTVDYASKALRKTGIIKFFRDVFGRETVSGEWGKHYKPVADVLEFSEEAMRANMIVVGDAPRDQPVDIDMVFLDLGLGGIEMDALVIREILTTVLDKGDGNFKNGFEKLYSEAIPMSPHDEPQHQHKTYDLGNGIRFELEYRNQLAHNIGERIVPVITEIQAPDYMREPLLIK
jgi:hypothetical protein